MGRAPAGQLTLAAAEGTLRHLTALTYLGLQDLHFAEPAEPGQTAQAAGSSSSGGTTRTTSELPSSFSALPCLETLCLKAFPPSLPASGPWLTSLRRLAVPATVAAASLAALSAMTQLEQLCLVNVEGALALE